MGFVIDGLHEDLNRIKKKPFVESFEFNGRNTNGNKNEPEFSDDLISRESWRRYLLRNDSELVDILYGQTKSHVTCVHCLRESVTFEAFNCLSLPIPVKNTFTISISIQLLPNMRIDERHEDLIRMTLDVSPGISISGLKDIVIGKLIQFNILPVIPPEVEGDRKKIKTDSDHAVVDTDEDGYVHVPRNLPDKINVNGNNGVNANKKVNYDEDSTDDELEDLYKSNNKTLRDTQTVDSSKIDLYARKYHFHVCNIWNSSLSRITSTLNDSNIVSKPIHSTHDQMYMVQLEYPTPTNPSTDSMNSYRSQYQQQPMSRESPALTNYVDVYNAEAAVYKNSLYNSNYSSVSLFGSPTRLSYIISETTCNEIHSKIWLFASKYISKNSRYLQYSENELECPYELIFSDHMGNMQGSLVDCDDVSRSKRFIG